MRVEPIFRQASLADIPAMSIIRLGVTENVLSDPARVTMAMYVDYLDKLGRSWVCEVDGNIAGFGAADKTDGSIWALFVDARYEGRGIGRGLLHLMQSYLFNAGHKVLVLSTTAGTRADAFYAAYGWQRSAVDQDGNVSFRLLSDYLTLAPQ